MTTTQAFVDGLNETFTQRLHKGLSAESLSDSDGAWHLLVRGDSGAALQDLRQAMRDEAVRSYLKAWTSGDLLVLVQGPSWCKPVPAAVVRGGALLFPARSITKFARWFEQRIGAPLPFDLDLDPMGRDLWGSAGAKGKVVRGLPPRLILENMAHYTAAGYRTYGYDSNFYYTRVSGPTRMYLRFPGYYRQLMIADLRAADRLFGMAVEKQLPMYLIQDNTEWYFADRPDPGQAQWSKLKAVQGYIEAAPE